MADGFSDSVGLDRSVIQAVGNVIKISSRFTEKLYQLFLFELLKIGAGFDPEFEHFFFRDSADPEELSDRQSIDEVICHFGCNHRYPIGFIHVRGNLGQKLVE